MKRWKIWLGIAALFLSGVVIGASVTAYLVKKRVGHWRGNNIEHASQHSFERLTRALELTPEQQEQIRPIVRETHKKLFELRRSARPKAREIIQSHARQIAELLEPKQKKKFRKILEKMREKKGPRGQSKGRSPL